MRTTKNHKYKIKIQKSEIVNAEIERMQKYEMQIQIEGSGSGARYDSVCQGNQTSHDTPTPCCSWSCNTGTNTNTNAIGCNRVHHPNLGFFSH